MRVFRYSGIQQKCNKEYFYQDMHLIADSAYTLQQHVMVPFRDDGHLTIEQIHFNKVLSRTRMIVERSIGLLKLRWRCLLNKLDMRRTDLIPYYVLACCILHNICLKEGDRFEYPIIVPDNAVNLEPLDIDNALKEQGIIKRERIMQFISENVY